MMSEQKKTVLHIISSSTAITRVSILITWPYNTQGVIIIDTNDIQIFQSLIGIKNGDESHLKCWFADHLYVIHFGKKKRHSTTSFAPYQF